ncbi:MAG: protein translocase subunit SecF [Gammaproteobacteria bacterium]|nr:protein translocase subunit SecF [Gammaproteobacteria bacterium]
MEFFHIRKDIPFMKYARSTTVVSAILFIAAVAALATRGLNLSIEFTGGILVEVRYAQAANLQQIRSVLEDEGYRDVTVQSYGTAQDVLIRLRLQQDKSSAQTSQEVLELLKRQEPNVELLRVEFVGPQVGQELYDSGGLALLLVCAGIMLYLAMRFEWRFAIAGIIANLHDVVIILGFFSFFQWEFTLAVLAGVLAVLGYSVNESVVIFDRIREIFRMKRKMPVPETIDHALTVTMSRTVITHTMTELVVLSMLFFGGEVLFYFALALTIGIVFGIYSSMLVASPIAMWLGVSRENLLPVKKEGAEADATTP